VDKTGGKANKNTWVEHQEMEGEQCCHCSLIIISRNTRSGWIWISITSPQLASRRTGIEIAHHNITDTVYRAPKLVCIVVSNGSLFDQSDPSTFHVSQYLD